MKNMISNIALFYENLRHLGLKPIEACRSSPPDPQSVPLVEDFSAHATFRAHKHRLSNSPVATPSKKVQQYRTNTPSKAVGLTVPLSNSEQLSSPSLPQPRAIIGRNHGPRSLPESLLPSETSDVSYQPTSTPLAASPESSSSYYDKPESDVVATARGFLYQLRDALRRDIPEMAIIVR